MKNKLFHSLRFAFYFVCLTTVFTVHAAAYIDPATTSYVIQIVAGIVIAAGTAIGIFWNKIKRKIKKTEKETESDIKNERESRGGVLTAEDLMSDDEEK